MCADDSETEDLFQFVGVQIVPKTETLILFKFQQIFFVHSFIFDTPKQPLGDFSVIFYIDVSLLFRAQHWFIFVVSLRNGKDDTQLQSFRGSQYYYISLTLKVSYWSWEYWVGPAQTWACGGSSLPNTMVSLPGKLYLSLRSQHITAALPSPKNPGNREVNTAINTCQVQQQEVPSALRRGIPRNFSASEPANRAMGFVVLLNIGDLSISLDNLPFPSG